MKALREKLAIQENMGVIDRSMRVLAGSLLTVPIIVAMANVDPIGWQLYATLFAFYLLLTGMMGWDPLYATFHGHTCGASERSRCGSFTYEMKAAMGRHPDHDPGYETHALKASERIKGVDSEGSWL